MTSLQRHEIESILRKYREAEQIIHNVYLPQAVEQQFHMVQTIEDIVGVNASAPDVTGGQNAASANSAPVPLIDYMSGNMDVLYYGPIQMGTGNQRLTVDIDTGSADLWVSWF